MTRLWLTALLVCGLSALAEAQPVPVPVPGAGDLGPDATGTGTALMFWVFAGLSVGGALFTITRRNPVVAVMSLVGTFIALAALFVMLFAHFLAAIQVLVYAGAIMVLFVFVVMILNREEDEPWAFRGWFSKFLAAGGLVYLVIRLATVLWGVKDRFLEPAWRPGEFAQYGTTKALGKELFTGYLFPFEAVSLVLVIAVVGGLVLAHPEHRSAVSAADPAEDKGSPR